METKKEKLVLHGTKCSRCNGPRMIVKSRDGGFVSQDCTKCGKSGYLPFNDLPVLHCSLCKSRLKTYISVYKNYCYKCEECKTDFELAAIVPLWSEHFDYDGLAIDPDSANLHY